LENSLRALGFPIAVISSRMKNRYSSAQNVQQVKSSNANLKKVDSSMDVRDINRDVILFLGMNQPGNFAVNASLPFPKTQRATKLYVQIESASKKGHCPFF